MASFLTRNPRAVPDHAARESVRCHHRPQHHDGRGSSLNFVCGVMLDHSSTLYVEGLVVGVIGCGVRHSDADLAKEQDKRLVRLRSFSSETQDAQWRPTESPLYENIQTMLISSNLPVPIDLEGTTAELECVRGRSRPSVWLRLLDSGA